MGISKRRYSPEKPAFRQMFLLSSEVLVMIAHAPYKSQLHCNITTAALIMVLQYQGTEDRKRGSSPFIPALADSHAHAELCAGQIVEHGHPHLLFAARLVA